MLHTTLSAHCEPVVCRFRAVERDSGAPLLPSPPSCAGNASRAEDLFRYTEARASLQPRLQAGPQETSSIEPGGPGPRPACPRPLSLQAPVSPLKAPEGPRAGLMPTTSKNSGISGISGSSGSSGNSGSNGSTVLRIAVPEAGVSAHTATTHAGTSRTA